MPYSASDRIAAVELAVALLAQAMHESHAPVHVLGNALELMTRALKQQGRARELTSAHETLERELAVCIESLQFHDRLMQQLTQVRECLSRLLLPADSQQEMPRWSEVRGRIAARLASDSQRALLDLLLPPGEGYATPGELRKVNVSEGSIELF